MSEHGHEVKAVDHPTIVFGGGVAGIAAAMRLAEQGVAVTLVEAKPRLGGRATSVEDKNSGDDSADGKVVDNCQHVLLKSCTTLIDLYRRLKVYKQIEWSDAMYFDDGLGGIDVLTADDLPAPLHLARSLTKFNGLSLSEKWALSRGMLAVMQVSRRGRELVRDESFADWLADHKQPESLIRKVWGPLVVSACNGRPEDTAASYALHALQDGLLSNESAYQVGLSTVPLVELYDEARPVIEAAGGQVITPRQVKSIELAQQSHAPEGGQTLSAEERVRIGHSQNVVAVVLNDGTRLEVPDSGRGGSVISAVPFDRLAAIIAHSPSALAVSDHRLENLDKLESSPIVGVHLFYRLPANTPVEQVGFRDDEHASDDHLIGVPHLVISSRLTQWLFDKGHQGTETVNEAGDAASLWHVHAVISAADEIVEWSAGEIADRVDQDIREVVPGMDAAELAHYRVIKEKQATFKATPGVDAYRPSAAGAIENFILAGDWTATGWPATMEGAARSGYIAAAEVLRRAGAATSASDQMPEELEHGVLYRLLAG